MKYHDSIAQADKKMAKCLDYLQRWQLPASPINFAIGYEYISGKNAALISSIKRRLEQNKNLDGFFAEELYQQYILGQSKFREGLIDDLDEIIEQVNTDFVESSQTVSDFVYQIDDSLEGLNSNNPDRIAQITKQLKAASKAVKDSQEKLLVQLATTKHQSEKLQTELADVRKEIFLDPLTGFYNRKAMQQHVDLWFQDEPEKQLSAIVVDIDSFNQFNESFGPLIGDVVLSKVAAKVKGYVDNSGLPVRLGGEEFAILLPDMETSVAGEIAEKIRQGVEKLRFVSSKSRVRLPKLTISLGVTSIKVGESIQQCLDRAELALDSAKLRGRNQVAIEAI